MQCNFISKLQIHCLKFSCCDSRMQFYATLLPSDKYIAWRSLAVCVQIRTVRYSRMQCNATLLPSDKYIAWSSLAVCVQIKTVRYSRMQYNTTLLPSDKYIAWNCSLCLKVCLRQGTRISNQTCTAQYNFKYIYNTTQLYCKVTSTLPEVLLLCVCKPKLDGTVENNTMQLYCQVTNTSPEVVCLRQGTMSSNQTCTAQ